MTREAARVSKVSARNSGGSERAWSISPMVSGGSMGRSAADAQRQAMSNPSKQVFRMGAAGSRLPRITPLVAEKTAGQGRDQGKMVVGLLGPNGAGKTTTVSMIAGLLAPDRGEVRIEGGVVRGETDPVKLRLGLVPQEVALHEELSAGQNLALFGAIYGMRGAALERAKIGRAHV